MSKTIGPRDDGRPKAIGLVPSAGRLPPGGATVREEPAVWIPIKIGVGDHLDVICATTAHPAIGDPDDCETICCCLRDRSAGGVIQRQHADVVPAIVECRHFGLAQYSYRKARLFEAPVFGDVEKLRQPGILVAAQRRIDRMISYNVGFHGVIADAAHCALSMVTRLGDAQTNSVGRHSLATPPVCDEACCGYFSAC